MHPHELQSALRALRLSGILESLEARNRQAVEGQLAYTEFLALLLQDEIARRDQRKFDTLLHQAHFRTHKTLEDFAFDRHRLSTATWSMTWPRAAICTRKRRS